LENVFQVKHARMNPNLKKDLFSPKRKSRVSFQTKEKEKVVPDEEKALNYLKPLTDRLKAVGQASDHHFGEPALSDTLLASNVKGHTLLKFHLGEMLNLPEAQRKIVFGQLVTMEQQRLFSLVRDSARRPVRSAIQASNQVIKILGAKPAKIYQYVHSLDTTVPSESDSDEDKKSASFASTTSSEGEKNEKRKGSKEPRNGSKEKRGDAKSRGKDLHKSYYAKTRSWADDFSKSDGDEMRRTSTGARKAKRVSTLGTRQVIHVEKSELELDGAVVGGEAMLQDSEGGSKEMRQGSKESSDGESSKYQPGRLKRGSTLQHLVTGDDEAAARREKRHVTVGVVEGSDDHETPEMSRQERRHNTTGTALTEAARRRASLDTDTDERMNLRQTSSDCSQIEMLKMRGVVKGDAAPHLEDEDSKTFSLDSPLKSRENFKTKFTAEFLMDCIATQDEVEGADTSSPAVAQRQREKRRTVISFEEPEEKVKPRKDLSKMIKKVIKERKRSRISFVDGEQRDDSSDSDASTTPSVCTKTDSILEKASLKSTILVARFAKNLIHRKADRKAASLFKDPQSQALFLELCIKFDKHLRKKGVEDYVKDATERVPKRCFRGAGRPKTAFPKLMKDVLAGNAEAAARKHHRLNKELLAAAKRGRENFKRRLTLVPTWDNDHAQEWKAIRDAVRMTKKLRFNAQQKRVADMLVEMNRHGISDLEQSRAGGRQDLHQTAEQRANEAKEHNLQIEQVRKDITKNIKKAIQRQTRSDRSDSIMDAEPVRRKTTRKNSRRSRSSKNGQLLEQVKSGGGVANWQLDEELFALMEAAVGKEPADDQPQDISPRKKQSKASVTSFQSYRKSMQERKKQLAMRSGTEIMSSLMEEDEQDMAPRHRARTISSGISTGSPRKLLETKAFERGTLSRRQSLSSPSRRLSRLVAKDAVDGFGFDDSPTVPSGDANAPKQPQACYEFGMQDNSDKSSSKQTRSGNKVAAIPRKRMLRPASAGKSRPASVIGSRRVTPSSEVGFSLVCDSRRGSSVCDSTRGSLVVVPVSRRASVASVMLSPQASSKDESSSSSSCSSSGRAETGDEATSETSEHYDPAENESEPESDAEVMGSMQPRRKHRAGYLLVADGSALIALAERMLRPKLACHGDLLEEQAGVPLTVILQTALVQDPELQSILLEMPEADYITAMEGMISELEDRYLAEMDPDEIANRVSAHALAAQQLDLGRHLAPADPKRAAQSQGSQSTRAPHGQRRGRFQRAGRKVTRAFDTQSLAVGRSSVVASQARRIPSKKTQRLIRRLVKQRYAKQPVVEKQMPTDFRSISINDENRRAFAEAAQSWIATDIEIARSTQSSRFVPAPSTAPEPRGRNSAIQIEDLRGALHEQVQRAFHKHLKLWKRWREDGTIVESEDAGGALHTSVASEKSEEWCGARESILTLQQQEEDAGGVLHASVASEKSDEWCGARESMLTLQQQEEDAGGVLHTSVASEKSEEWCGARESMLTLQQQEEDVVEQQKVANQPSQLSPAVEEFDNATTELTPHQPRADSAAAPQPPTFSDSRDWTPVSRDETPVKEVQNSYRKLPSMPVRPVITGKSEPYDISNAKRTGQLPTLSDQHALPPVQLEAAPYQKFGTTVGPMAKRLPARMLQKGGPAMNSDHYLQNFDVLDLDVLLRDYSRPGTRLSRPSTRSSRPGTRNSPRELLISPPQENHEQDLKGERLHSQGIEGDLDNSVHSSQSTRSPRTLYSASAAMSTSDEWKRMLVSSREASQWRQRPLFPSTAPDGGFKAEARGGASATFDGGSIPRLPELGEDARRISTATGASRQQEITGAARGLARICDGLEKQVATGMYSDPQVGMSPSRLAATGSPRRLAGHSPRSAHMSTLGQALRL
jgi:hypothetical protein